MTRLSSLALIILVAGCAHGGFDRFMDHPVLSWLPLDKWGVVGSAAPAASGPSYQFPDRACFNLAAERTQFLDRSEFDDADLRKIFTLTYQNCVKTKR